MFYSEEILLHNLVLLFKKKKKKVASCQSALSSEDKYMFVTVHPAGQLQRVRQSQVSHHRTKTKTHCAGMTDFSWSSNCS